MAEFLRVLARLRDIRIRDCLTAADIESRKAAEPSAPTRIGIPSARTPGFAHPAIPDQNVTVTY